MNPRKIILAQCLCLIIAMNASPATTGPTTQESAAEKVPASQPTARVILARLTDLDGNALPSGTIRIESFPGQRDFPVDRDGKALVQLPPIKPHEYGFRLIALAPGYAPGWAQWNFPPANPQSEPAAELMIALPRGATVSGTLCDEQHKAISGAKVRLFFQTADALKQNESPPGTFWHSLWDYTVQTDDHGRWRCDMAPREWTQAWIMPSHPDYFAPEYLVEAGEAKALLSGSAEAVMTRGRPVAGTVIGSDGKPVAGAVVQCGNQIRDGNPRAISAQDGRFVIPHADSASRIILARASGLAPAIARLPAGDIADFQLNLQLPSKLNGRILDEKGLPIAEGAVSLTSLGEKMGELSIADWTIYSNADGRFQLDVPPSTPATLFVYKDGFVARRDVRISNTKELQIIVLRRPMKAIGRVTDRATGKSILNFHAVSATDDPGQASSWGDPATDGKDGQYELAFDADVSHRVRVEAEGYLPAWSQDLQFVNGQAVFDAALTAAPSLEGAVFGPDGEVVSGARVMVITNSSGFPTINAELKNDNGGYYKETVTDARGRFYAPPPGEPYDLLVLHGSGYAKVAGEAFETSKTIHLIRWARIEGTVRDNLEPAANVLVFAHDDFAGDSGNSTIGFWPFEKTDRNGHYVMEHVPAGSHAIIRGVDFADQTETGFQCKTLATDAGQTYNMDFGAAGRTVSGVAIVPRDLPKNWQFAIPALIHIDNPSIPPAIEAWSPQTTFTRGFSRTYRFEPRNDGSFRIPAVEPGEYCLVIQAAEPVPGSFCGTGDEVAEFVQNLTVDANSSTPIDLGKCVLLKTKRISIGEAAPDFQCQSLEGKSLRLSDFRGKYVLLTFWASWCGPCVEETPYLTKIRHEFGSNGRFAMIGLNLDDNSDAAKRFIAQNGIAWDQASLPQGFDSKIAQDYCLHAIPSIWLIDPQGNVAAKELSPSGLESTIAQSLSK